MLAVLLSLGITATGLWPASSPAAESLECELTMSMAPVSEPVSHTASGPLSKSTAELCSEAGDPRCQLQQGESETQPRLPRFASRALATSDSIGLLAPLGATAGVFHYAPASDSGFLSSLFRPPR